MKKIIVPFILLFLGLSVNGCRDKEAEERAQLQRELQTLSKLVPKSLSLDPWGTNEQETNEVAKKEQGLFEQKFGIARRV